MLRTRDVVIFSGTLLFLLICIAMTIYLDRQDNTQAFSLDVTDMQASQTFTAEGENDQINRDSIISRLRTALSLREPEVEPVPSVETQLSTSSESDLSLSADEDESLVLHCGGDDALSAQRMWPLRDISIVEQGNFRQVLHAPASAAVVESNASTSAASQASSAEQNILIQFPVTPYASAEPSCVPSEVIGVTISGSLMYNSETAFYRGYGSEYLIGYARDGYPIYGYYDGQVDQCGGYMHPSGYRYTISEDQEVILSCFTATPASFHF